MLGTHLTTFFNPLRVNILSRNPKPHPWANTYYWNIEKHQIDPEALRDVDYVVSLAGSDLFGNLWTMPFSRSSRQRVYDSRVYATKLLVHAISDMNKKPKVFISASGINYYNFTNDHEQAYDEDSPPGDSFLSLLCRDWENASRPLTQMGVRVVHLRFSLILHPYKGTLRRMYSLAKPGFLSVLGSGKQKINFVHIDDACGMIIRAMMDEHWWGPFNVVTERPVTNEYFTRYIITYLSKAQYLDRLPSFLLRVLLRDFSDVLLRGGVVLPEKAKKYGFSFQYPSFDVCMENLTSDDGTSWLEGQIASQQ